MRKITLFFSSVFGLGYISKAPGTVSSVGAALLWYFFAPEDYFIQAFVIIVAVFASIVFSSAAEKIYKTTDDGRITIDELAGMWISLAFLPKTALFAILGFVLFRFFDIKKPWIIDKAQKFKGGLGITADDVVAGVFANIILQALYHLCLK